MNAQVESLIDQLKQQHGNENTVISIVKDYHVMTVYCVSQTFELPSGFDDLDITIGKPSEIHTGERWYRVGIDPYDPAAEFVTVNVRREKKHKDN
jgi:hypothetical protein